MNLLTLTILVFCLCTNGFSQNQLDTIWHAKELSFWVKSENFQYNPDSFAFTTFNFDSISGLYDYQTFEINGCPWCCMIYNSYFLVDEGTSLTNRIVTRHGNIRYFDGSNENFALFRNDSLISIETQIRHQQFLKPDTLKYPYYNFQNLNLGDNEKTEYLELVRNELLELSNNLEELVIESTGMCDNSRFYLELFINSEGLIKEANFLKYPNHPFSKAMKKKLLAAHLTPLNYNSENINFFLALPINIHWN